MPTTERRRRKAWSSAPFLALPALPAGLGLLGCNSPQEPVRVNLPVVVDATRIQRVTTDLDYEVEVTEARIVVKDFTFAIAGELHGGLRLREAYQRLIPAAHAHPGHYQGGDITGEMPGNFRLDWLPGEATNLGDALLLVGKYHSANFVFARATAQELKEGDPLVGHTTILRGTAERESNELTFLALIDSPEDRQLVGIPFEVDIKEASDVALHVQLETVDELEGDSLFDGLDFLKLDADGDGDVEIVPDADSEAVVDAYNLLRRTLQTHDHFEIVAVPLK